MIIKNANSLPTEYMERHEIQKKCFSCFFVCSVGQFLTIILLSEFQVKPNEQYLLRIETTQWMFFLILIRWLHQSVGKIKMYLNF